MKQDDFVLHASEGDMARVKQGLEEKRLCSVKGTHQEKVTDCREDEIVELKVHCREPSLLRNYLGLPGSFEILTSVWSER